MHKKIGKHHLRIKLTAAIRYLEVHGSPPKKNSPKKKTKEPHVRTIYETSNIRSNPSKPPVPPYSYRLYGPKDDKLLEIWSDLRQNSVPEAPKKLNFVVQRVIDRIELFNSEWVRSGNFL